MSIENKIQQLKENLSFFEEEIEKYEYIIELGKSSKPLEQENKIQENLIQGCTSRLWIVFENDDDKIIFRTDSDTVIVRGLAEIITNILSNQTAQDIINFDINILATLGLTQIITPSRQNGVNNLVKRIKKYAQQTQNN